jgi:transcriptional regulator with XRE-family HTH domain
VSGTDAERMWLRTVGMRIRLARVARRESQDARAIHARVSRVTLGSVERGDHPAGVLTYVRVARTIGIPLDELLDGTP